MRVPRFAAHLIAIAGFAGIAVSAPAQDWPSGTVRVVVPYAPGGPVDVPARLLIERLAASPTFVARATSGCFLKPAIT